MYMKSFVTDQLMQFASPSTETPSPLHRWPTEPELVILRVLQTTLRSSDFPKDIDAEIDTAIRYLRGFYDQWTKRMVTDWLRRHESGIGFAPLSPRAVPHLSALGIARRIPRHSRADRPFKHASLPTLPAAIVIQKPSSDLFAGLPQAFSPPPPSSPITETSVDSANLVTLIERIVIKILNAGINASHMTQELIGEPNAPLVDFLCDEISQRLHAVVHTLALDIETSCRAALIAIMKAHENKLQTAERLEHARACRAESKAKRIAKCQAAGIRLVAFRRQLAQSFTLDLIGEDMGSQTDSMDITGVIEDRKLKGNLDLIGIYKVELESLWSIPLEHANLRRFSDSSISIQFGFLFASVSNQALKLLRQILPFPSSATIRRHYSATVASLIDDLSDITACNRLIQLAIESGDLPPAAVVALSVDAMALNSDGSQLPGNDSQNAFVFYVQPLDARFKCFPVHVISHPSGRATAPIQTAMEMIGEAIIAQGLHLKYLCADGDSCHNRRHFDFFQLWYPILVEKGLSAALAFLDTESRIPIGDFLHIWKVYCNKIKAHPVTLIPSSASSAIHIDDLESILQLGSALRDKSSIGRMRDSYPIQLFSWCNCIKCVKNGMLHEFMYLLVWTLQEEIIRSIHLCRDQRLLKAILCFKLLMHYFDLSRDSPGRGVTKRFKSGSTIAVTFAEDSVWPVLLNTTLALVHFILGAQETWSFSRMGTHCLENFFGLVRREAMGDDRYAIIKRIIAKASLAASIMHDLHLRIIHRGRDNIGGVVIGGGRPEFTEEMAELLFRSLVHLSDLELFPIEEAGLFTMDDLKCLLSEWLEHDHHGKDPIYHASFISRPSGVRIIGRLIPTSVEHSLRGVQRGDEEGETLK
jgi:hypothetical protein